MLLLVLPVVLIIAIPIFLLNCLHCKRNSESRDVEADGQTKDDGASSSGSQLFSQVVSSVGDDHPQTVSGDVVQVPEYSKVKTKKKEKENQAEPEYAVPLKRKEAEKDTRRREDSDAVEYPHSQTVSTELQVAQYSKMKLKRKEKKKTETAAPEYAEPMNRDKAGKDTNCHENRNNVDTPYYVNIATPEPKKQGNKKPQPKVPDNEVQYAELDQSALTSSVGPRVAPSNANKDALVYASLAHQTK